GGGCGARSANCGVPGPSCGSPAAGPATARRRATPRRRAARRRLLDPVRPLPYSEDAMGLCGGRSASGVTEDAVLNALRAVRDPDSGQDIVTLGLVQGLGIEGGRVTFTLEFTSQPALAKVEIHSQARKVV